MTQKDFYQVLCESLADENIREKEKEKEKAKKKYHYDLLMVSSILSVPKNVLEQYIDENMSFSNKVHTSETTYTTFTYTIQEIVYGEDVNGVSDYRIIIRVPSYCGHDVLKDAKNLKEFISIYLSGGDRCEDCKHPYIHSRIKRKLKEFFHGNH